MPIPVPLPAIVRRFMGSELFRYLVAGTIAFICDFAVLVYCTELLGIHYLYSNIAGYAAGLIVSYTINIKWVFNHRRFDHRQGFEFVYFTVIVIVGLGVSELAIWLATESFEMPYTISKVISSIFVFGFNYIAKKWLLFSPARDQPAATT